MVVVLCLRIMKLGEPLWRMCWFRGETSEASMGRTPAKSLTDLIDGFAVYCNFPELQHETRQERQDGLHCNIPTYLSGQCAYATFCVVRCMWSPWRHLWELFPVVTIGAKKNQILCWGGCVSVTCATDECVPSCSRDQLLRFNCENQMDKQCVLK